MHPRGHLHRTHPVQTVQGMGHTALVKGRRPPTQPGVQRRHNRLHT